jgi:hypothetical protein
MPISVSQNAIIPDNFRKSARRQLSMVKRAVDAFERNAKATQLAIQYAKQVNRLNAQFSHWVEDTYRAIDAIKDAQKIFQLYSSITPQMSLYTAYSYHEKFFPFHQYENFWPSFSQPPRLPAFSTFLSSEVIREKSLLPKFYPQRVGSKKSNLNKTIAKKFSTREKSWEKTCRYFVPKENREKLGQFWRDLQEDNQTMERGGISKSKIFISSCVKVFNRIWYIPVGGGGIIYLFKNFFN